MGEFELFNREARSVLRRAQEEAIPRDHAFIAPEHLLLGLLRERRGIASKVLRELKLPETALVLTLDRAFDDFKRATLGDIELSDRSIRVLALGVDERRTRRHDKFGTSHMLLGLCAEEEEFGAGILQCLGLDVSTVRTEVLAFIETRSQKSGGGRRFWSWLSN